MRNDAAAMLAALRGIEARVTVLEFTADLMPVDAQATLMCVCMPPAFAGNVETFTAALAEWSAAANREELL